jgi:hypothetical protein
MYSIVLNQTRSVLIGFQAECGEKRDKVVSTLGFISFLSVKTENTF